MSTVADETKAMPVGEDKKIEDVGEKRTGSEDELETNAVDYDEKEARRILSKVDYRLVPILSLLYLVAFIDRSNSKLSIAQDAHVLTSSSRQCESRRLDDGSEHAWLAVQHCSHAVFCPIHAARSAE